MLCYDGKPEVKDGLNMDFQNLLYTMIGGQATIGMMVCG